MLRRSRFTLWKSEKDGLFYWTLVANNNEIIASSEGYHTKASAKKGIRAVRRCFAAPIKDLTVDAS